MAANIDEGPARKRLRTVWTDPEALTGSEQPEQLSSTTQWDDIHFDLLEDIFKHLTTLQRAEFRRVSKGWNEIHRGTGSTLSFRLKELKAFEAFCHKTPKNGWKNGASKGFLPSMITPFTKFCFIDCQLPQKMYESYTEDWQTAVCGGMSWKMATWKPLPRLSECHPQIKRIVIANMLTGLKDLNGQKLSTNSLKFLGCSSAIGRGLSVTVLRCELQWLKPRRVRNHKKRDRFWRISLPSTTMTTLETGVTSKECFMAPLIKSVLEAMEPYSTVEKNKILSSYPGFVPIVDAPQV